MRYPKLILAVGLLILFSAWIALGQDPWICYQADFSSANSIMWSTSDSPKAKRWISDGRYNMLIEYPKSQAWIVANCPLFRNFRLDVDTLVGACPADNEYGVLFRFAQGDSCYAFIISADGYIKLTKRLNGGWVTLVPRKRCYSVKLGQASNHLTVIADGPRLSCYVNSGKVLEITDSSVGRGRIGFVAAVNQYASFHVAFDNVTLRALHDR